MKVSEFKNHLLAAGAHEMRFALPDGDLIPAHAHVTEIGRVDKNFIDCGGTGRSASSCMLQIWVAENDEDHRFAPGKLAAVMDMATPLFRGDDLDMEVEYEDCSISQYRIVAAQAENGVLNFLLATKHTDCLAKEACGLVAADSKGCGC